MCILFSILVLFGAPLIPPVSPDSENSILEFPLTNTTHMYFFFFLVSEILLSKYLYSLIHFWHYLWLEHVVLFVMVVVRGGDLNWQPFIGHLTS